RVVRLAQRSLPHDEFLAHPPVARRGLRGFGKLSDDSPDVLPRGHGIDYPLMPYPVNCLRNARAASMSSSTRCRCARFSNTPLSLREVPTIAPSAISNGAAMLSARTRVFTKPGPAPAALFTRRSAVSSVGEPAVAPETQIASGKVAKTVVLVMDSRSR